jgi:transposase, IS6 family
VRRSTSFCRPNATH